MLEERDPELGDFRRAVRMPDQEHQGGDRDERLPENLLPRGNAVAALAHGLEVVVAKAHAGERGEDEHADDHPDIGPRPEEGAAEHGEKDQQTAHRRRVLLVEPLGEVAGAVVIIMLADLARTQPRDEPGGDQEADGRGRARGQERAQRDETQQAQRAEVVVELRQVAQHGTASRDAPAASALSSSYRRLPFRKTAPRNPARNAATGARSATISIWPTGLPDSSRPARSAVARSPIPVGALAPAFHPLTLYAIEEQLIAMADTAELVPEEHEQAFLEEFRAALTAAVEKRDRVGQFLAHLEQQAAFAKAPYIETARHILSLFAGGSSAAAIPSKLSLCRLRK